MFRMCGRFSRPSPAFEDSAPRMAGSESAPRMRGRDMGRGAFPVRGKALRTDAARRRISGIGAVRWYNSSHVYTMRGNAEPSATRLRE